MATACIVVVVATAGIAHERVPASSRGRRATGSASVSRASGAGVAATATIGADTGDAPIATTASTLAVPVIDADAADPYVLTVGARYYLFATNANGRHVPVWVSEDRERWTLVGDAMPNAPAWAQDSTAFTWAPSVARIGDAFVMYVSVPERSSGRLCIAALTATLPSGPYRSSAAGPLACSSGAGNAYDASPYTDADGARWLLWRDDGRGAIVSARTSDDGREIAGREHVLVRADRSWEHGWVEGPTASVLPDGSLLLLYSAGDWKTDGYSTGIASCRSATGGCTKANAPLLRSGDAGSGPGGASMFTDADGLHAVYAAWRGVPDTANSYRAAYVVRLGDAPRSAA